jgi:hypothetical protein
LEGNGSFDLHDGVMGNGWMCVKFQGLSSRVDRT